MHGMALLIKKHTRKKKIKKTGERAKGKAATYRRWSPRAMRCEAGLICPQRKQPRQHRNQPALNSPPTKGIGQAKQSSWIISKPLRGRFKGGQRSRTYSQANKSPKRQSGIPRLCNSRSGMPSPPPPS